jgi:hypothetical protein
VPSGPCWPAQACANPYDNAWSESFIGTLKREMLQDGCFEDAVDVRLELFDYINNQRKHSAIVYMPPTSSKLNTQTSTNQATLVQICIAPQFTSSSGLRILCRIRRNRDLPVSISSAKPASSWCFFMPLHYLQW